MIALSPLRLRAPNLPWLVTAAVAALSVHGAIWFVFDTVVGQGQVAAQMAMALGWIICTLALWLMSPPVSRMHAFISGCLCALAMTLLGTFTAWLRLSASSDVPQAFTLMGGVLIVLHLVLAIPAILALQGVALTRRG